MKIRRAYLNDGQALQAIWVKDFGDVATHGTLDMIVEKSGATTKLWDGRIAEICSSEIGEVLISDQVKDEELFNVEVSGGTTGTATIQYRQYPTKRDLIEGLKSWPVPTGPYNVCVFRSRGKTHEYFSLESLNE